MYWNSVLSHLWSLLDHSFWHSLSWSCCFWQIFGHTLLRPIWFLQLACSRLLFHADPLHNLTKQLIGPVMGSAQVVTSPKPVFCFWHWVFCLGEMESGSHYVGMLVVTSVFGVIADLIFVCAQSWCKMRATYCGSSMIWLIESDLILSLTDLLTPPPTHTHLRDVMKPLIMENTQSWCVTVFLLCFPIQVIGHSNFGSIRATTCVYKGKD